MYNESEGLLIRRILSPITVLGPGKRTGIWLQGCSIHCKGCSSPETWDFDTRFFWSYKKIRAVLEECLQKSPDGVSILGGEPFDQPEGLLNLLKILKNLKTRNILAYSGYPYEAIKMRFPKHFEYIDILISGPYCENISNERLWRGSDNQIISVISERAKREYDEPELNQMQHPVNRKLEIFIDEKDQIVIVGIPKRGEINRIYE